MVNVYPDYYENFRCIAEKCKNNCCKGWEIDIDEKTLDKYSSLEGALGEKLRKSISRGECASFILCEDERCPFLNAGNLCEIILEKGEDFLCNICKDHPRFRNFFTDVTETGIGLACEEAARIILYGKTEFGFEADGDITQDEEYQPYYAFRKRLLNMICKGDSALEERISCVKNALEISEYDFSVKEIIGLLLSLEILSEEWKELLLGLKDNEGTAGIPFDDENVCLRLICYFIFRHFADCFFEGEIAEGFLFAVLCTRIINYIKHYCGLSYEEAARMFSSETEYSKENTNALIEAVRKSYEI